MVQHHPVKDDEDLPEPPQVRRLRLLVSVLMIVMIGGMLIVTVSMVLRLGVLGTSKPASVTPIDAAQLALPQSHEIVSVGRGTGEVLVVTRDAAGAETLRAFDAATGALKSATPIIRE